MQDLFWVVIHVCLESFTMRYICMFQKIFRHSNLIETSLAATSSTGLFPFSWGHRQRETRSSFLVARGLALLAETRARNSRPLACWPRGEPEINPSERRERDHHVALIPFTASSMHRKGRDRFLGVENVGR